MNLSEKLKNCRISKKLTQAEVAKLLHVSRKTISGWENSHSYPDISSLTQLSRIYDISLDDLLQDNHVITDCDTKKKHLNYRVIKISYNLNVILCILSFLEFFNFQSPHVPIIYFLLLGNLLIYIYYFSRVFSWNILKGRVIVFLFLFIFLFALYTFLNILLIGTSNFLIHADPYFIFGFSFGRLLLILGVTLSSEVILLSNYRK
ncbi:hypothetical protein FC19_GL001663 [Liquorilactobacillus aquaticus DSM 21051]|uniref:HTH cro/C1-type domain-containing protein n=1 Tax=Liquorilactobacillus aquaticus DSM 21051 TaxID=1423725 RepID=A0A0R2DB82_9LACO|nr:helix-turn-helix transcriptional regulator [Liquorilactobacillus aquaticus]KRM97612.1 hypothetical protein FC19_GL001663 [Liquorilactobacillus aquaticus DSM 21051]